MSLQLRIIIESVYFYNAAAAEDHVFIRYVSASVSLFDHGD